MGSIPMLSTEIVLTILQSGRVPSILEYLAIPMTQTKGVMHHSHVDMKTS